MLHCAIRVGLKSSTSGLRPGASKDVKPKAASDSAAAFIREKNHDN